MNSYTNQQNAYRKASVNTLDQNKLIVMLYDGAIKQAGFAVEHIKKNEIEKALQQHYMTWLKELACYLLQSYDELIVYRKAKLHKAESIINEARGKC